jgi:hypothetical protein
MVSQMLTVKKTDIPKTENILGTLVALSIIGGSIYLFISLFNGLKASANQGDKTPLERVSLQLDN